MEESTSRWVSDIAIQFAGQVPVKEGCDAIGECIYIHGSKEYRGNRASIGGLFTHGESPVELSAYRRIHEKMGGRVLIAGLGTGISTRIALANKEITEIVVVEESLELIKAVKPTLPENVQVVNSSPLEFRPGGIFQWAYLDLWTVVCLEDLSEVYEVRDRYSRFSTKRLDFVTELVGV